MQSAIIVLPSSSETAGSTAVVKTASRGFPAMRPRLRAKTNFDQGTDD